MKYTKEKTTHLITCEIFSAYHPNAGRNIQHSAQNELDKLVTFLGFLSTGQIKNNIVQSCN